MNHILGAQGNDQVLTAIKGTSDTIPLPVLQQVLTGFRRLRIFLTVTDTAATVLPGLVPFVLASCRSFSLFNPNVGSQEFTSSSHCRSRRGPDRQECSGKVSTCTMLYGREVSLCVAGCEGKLGGNKLIIVPLADENIGTDPTGSGSSTFEYIIDIDAGLITATPDWLRRAQWVSVIQFEEEEGKICKDPVGELRLAESQGLCSRWPRGKIRKAGSAILRLKHSKEEEVAVSSSENAIMARSLQAIGEELRGSVQAGQETLGLHQIKDPQMKRRKADGYI